MINNYNISFIKLLHCMQMALWVTSGLFLHRKLKTLLFNFNFYFFGLHVFDSPTKKSKNHSYMSGIVFFMTNKYVPLNINISKVKIIQILIYHR